MNKESNEVVLEIGCGLDKRVTPCSTFKMALSVMGFDSGVLIDIHNPVWLFQEGYDDYLESWKQDHTPQSWMKNSVVWYSKILTTNIGLENFKAYLAGFQYGNQDASGGLTQAWLSSSLKISPREQCAFIQNLINQTLPASVAALQITKNLLFLEELSGGWKLYGKTGSGSINEPEGSQKLGWFVGWIEKDNTTYIFAYNICDAKIDLSERIPRVKQLIKNSGITCSGFSLFFK